MRLTVQLGTPGQRLDPGFIGLGLEANTLARDEFAHTDLPDYLRLLDPHGTLRIGGNSVESFWTSRGEPAPAWSKERITPADLDALARMLRGTGWKVILGVAFKHSDPARAADEARYAARILGPALRGIEIGNEPDHYGISEQAYFAGFERFAAAIRAAVPGVALIGPGMGRDVPTWVSAFARDEAPHPDIALFTTHEYPLSECGGEHPTIAKLLAPSAEHHEIAAADSAVAGARELGVPAVIDETNSVVCWGAPGVSNVYASALWILDYGLLLADHGVAAANFQTRIAGCTPYLPLCTLPHSHRLYARPEFYGLLALAQAGSGRFLRIGGVAPATLHAYALDSGGGRLSVVLDNTGPASTLALAFQGAHISSARRTLLATSSGRGLSATTDITLGGQAVGTGGRFAAPRYTPVPLTGATATVRVPADSATILKLS